MLLKLDSPIVRKYLRKSTAAAKNDSDRLLSPRRQSVPGSNHIQLWPNNYRRLLGHLNL